VATCCPQTIEKYASVLAGMVKDERINNSARLKLAISYLKKHANLENVATEDIEKACGVGVEVSDEQIKGIINELFKAHE